MYIFEDVLIWLNFGGLFVIRIACEMCGGNNLLKEDGFYVCQNCGTKYTVEEAKKLIIEGSVDVSGSTVKVDNSGLILNYMMMAENAYNSNNKSEAESYCNKIIEIAPQNSEAWFLKGKAAGWQSTGNNLRLEETVNCFINAVSFSSKDNLLSLQKDVAASLIDLSFGMVKLAGDLFVDFASEDGANRIIDIVQRIQASWQLITDKTGVPMPTDYGVLSNYVNASAVNSWNNHVIPDFRGNDNHPSKYQFQKMIEETEYCKKLLLFAIDIAPRDTSNNILRYKSLITMTQFEISAGPSEFFVETRGYHTVSGLPANTVSRLRTNISEWEGIIRQLDPSQVVQNGQQAVTPDERNSLILKNGLFLILELVFEFIAITASLMSIASTTLSIIGLAISAVIFIISIVFVYGNKTKNKRFKAPFIIALICMITCVLLLVCCGIHPSVNNT